MLPNSTQATKLTALQWMLLTNDEDRILLFPAWPEAWPDVDFKLRTWLNTTVEVSCRGGVTTSLAVTPAGQKRDIVFVGGTCRPSPGVARALARDV